MEQAKVMFWGIVFAAMILVCGILMFGAYAGG